jgi:hypothetical protein
VEGLRNAVAGIGNWLWIRKFSNQHRKYRNFRENKLAVLLFCMGNTYRNAIGATFFLAVIVLK